MPPCVKPSNVVVPIIVQSSATGLSERLASVFEDLGLTGLRAVEAGARSDWSPSC